MTNSMSGFHPEIIVNFVVEGGIRQNVHALFYHNSTILRVLLSFLLSSLHMLLVFKSIDTQKDQGYYR